MGGGFVRADGESPWSTLYAVVDGRLRAVARVGDRDGEGNTICIINSNLINANGTVAFAARVTPPGYACSADPYAGEPIVPFLTALYVDDGQLRRVGGTGALSPAGWQLTDLGLYALNDDDEALILALGSESPGEATAETAATSSATTILAVGPGGARIAYRIGAVDGPQEIAAGNRDDFWIEAINSAGEVVFSRRDAAGLGLYRTAGGSVERLFAAGDPAPWGGAYTDYDAYAWAPRFNARGDLLRVQGDLRRLVLYAADGTVRVFPERALAGELNDRGDVAFVHFVNDGSLEVLRHRDGTVRRLATTGDRLPSGAALAQQGIGAGCMAANGAVGVSAQITTAETGLLCGDVRGFRPVVRMGDPRPEGRRFYRFENCAFGRSEELVFVASALVPAAPREYLLQSAVYRALPDRLERVLGPGDVLADGATIKGFSPYWAHVFDADDSGRVLALASTTQGAALIVAHADTLERLPLRLTNSMPTDDRIRFEPDSTIDHEYLAGVSGGPRSATASSLHGMTEAAPAGNPDDQQVELWVTQAQLAAPSGAFVLGTETTIGAAGEWRLLPFCCPTRRRRRRAPHRDQRRREPPRR